MRKGAKHDGDLIKDMFLGKVKSRFYQYEKALDYIPHHNVFPLKLGAWL